MATELKAALPAGPATSVAGELEAAPGPFDSLPTRRIALEQVVVMTPLYWSPKRGTTVSTPKFSAGLTTLDDTFLYLRDENSQDLKDNVIQVGGIFETKEDAILFQAAVDVINEDSTINMEPDLAPLVELLPEDDSYEAVRDTCRLLLRGVGAVFGPMSSVSGEHVSDVCNSLNVPHLETRWDPAQEAYDDSLNLVP
ncbi:hypothetical protein MTO96_010933 [Rhipicephalus appendiculatus]